MAPRITKEAAGLTFCSNSSSSSSSDNSNGNNRELQLQSESSIYSVAIYLFARATGSSNARGSRKRREEGVRTCGVFERVFRVLTTQLIPYLCPENSAICTALWGSEMSQTRTFGMWPHSPVARSLPSPASAKEVTVLRQAFNTCAWVFRRGLNSTTVQLQQGTE